MENVVLVIHLILALGIIGLVLIQKSEGGGLGIGGSGGLGNIATARSTGNILTRLTAIFATGFFITSLTLSIMAGHHSKDRSITEQLDKPVAVETQDAPEPSVPLSTE